MSSVVEELPLIRGKGEAAARATGPSVGPGTYNPDKATVVNASRAPFNSTSTRQQLGGGDVGLPGPGTYDPSSSSPYKPAVLGSQAFVSESPRFAVVKGSDAPGPGAYNATDRYSVRKNPRSHTFSGPYASVADLSQGANLGPGSYNPNYSAADRKLPKASEFSKYSSREVARPAPGPGPGTYDFAQAPRAATTGKPSSMFVTKTKRTVCGGAGASETPGPGSYNLLQPHEREFTIPREHFSAFGSSSLRFANDRGADGAPGPGMYAGDIAPRRYHPQSGNGSAAFVSTRDRFPDSFANSAPGPGTYDGRKLQRHHTFGEPMPFGSTVPRFSPVWSQHPQSEPLIFSGGSHDGRGARRGAPRPFIQRKITPSSAPAPLQDRVYDVRYDWPKPVSNADTTFGGSRRQLPYPLAAADAPGPGSYSATGGFAAAGLDNRSSTWGRDVRFANTLPQRGAPDPGKYYHSSTFLTKSHNRTIGSDTTWID